MLAIGAVLAGLALATGVAAAGNEIEAEPSGYRMEEFRSPVPATLKGATVVDTEGAHALWEKGATLFIDVLPQAPKPAGLPEGTVWRDKKRFDIPGSYWLPNVGYGRLNPKMSDWFKGRLAELTGGDKAKPILFYCLDDCWMSWNAAKRAIEEYGYTDVSWYPEGTDGWAFQDYPLKETKPEWFVP